MAQMGPFINWAKLATKYRPVFWPLYRQETTRERPISPSKRTISYPLETKATPIFFKKKPLGDFLLTTFYRAIYILFTGAKTALLVA